MVVKANLTSMSQILLLQYFLQLIITITFMMYLMLRQTIILLLKRLQKLQLKFLDQKMLN